MKTIQFPYPNRAVLLSGILIACGLLSPRLLQASGLDGDTIQGYLSIPWSPGSGNYFTQDASGYPTSSLPIYAVVGSGIEFDYHPAQVSTFTWQVTADVSGNQIIINESLSDPSPSYWLGEFTSWTLTISNLDWAGSASLGNLSYVSQDASISVQSYDAHSISFAIDEITVYPTGPYSISRTTVVELSPVPEPGSAALMLGIAVSALWRKHR